MTLSDEVTRCDYESGHCSAALCDEHTFCLALLTFCGARASPMQCNVVLRDCSCYVTPSVQKLAGASLLVFANKQDLAGALSDDDIAELLDLASIKNRHWKIQACSAVSGKGLLDGIDWMVNDIASRIFMLD